MSDGRRAYVTLVTNADYAIGAAALVRSLRLSQTEAAIVVLHTEAVGAASLAPLAALGARLSPAALLNTSDGFNERHARSALHAAAPFTKGEKPAFHTPLDNFVKLRLWQLTEYDRCIFLDADTLVLKNIDRLFEYPEFAAAPNVYERLGDFHRLNSGVFAGETRGGDIRRDVRAAGPPGRVLAAYRPDLSRSRSFPTGMGCRCSSTCCNMSG